MRQNQLRAIFLITPTTTSEFAAYPYTTETQKATKIWIFQLGTLYPHGINEFLSVHIPSCHRVSSNCKALPHPDKNRQHPQFLYSLWKRANARRVRFPNLFEDNSIFVSFAALCFFLFLKLGCLPPMLAISVDHLAFVFEKCPIFLLHLSSHVRSLLQPLFCVKQTQ